jgi:hypothetical protein
VLIIVTFAEQTLMNVLIVLMDIIYMIDTALNTVQLVITLMVKYANVVRVSVWNALMQ